MAEPYLLHLALQLVRQIQRRILPALHPRQLLLLEPQLCLRADEALAEIGALLLERFFQLEKPLFNPG